MTRTGGFPKHPGQVAGVAAAVAALLALSKIGFYFASGSLLVALSALDSSMDVLVSFLNKKVIQFARQEADADHPYGHGKAESLASLAQGALIAAGSFGISIEAIRDLKAWMWEGVVKAPAPTFLSGFFLLAALLSFLLTRWMRTQARAFQSPALDGDAEHYASDVWTNLASGLALGLIYFTNYPWLDSILSLFFAVWVFKTALVLMRESAHELIDRDMPMSNKEKIVEHVLTHYPTVQDVHKLRGRRSGHRCLMDLHVTLPGQMSFQEVHALLEHLEKDLAATFDADVVVHPDPEEAAQEAEGPRFRRPLTPTPHHPRETTHP